MILLKLELHTGLSQKSQISNFTKIYPQEAALIHAERQLDGCTDMVKLLVLYATYVNMPRNSNKASLRNVMDSLNG
jgi:hypothetical protein